jgi:hypothetical protein
MNATTNDGFCPDCKKPIADRYDHDNQDPEKNYDHLCWSQWGGECSGERGGHAAESVRRIRGDGGSRKSSPVKCEPRGESGGPGCPVSAMRPTERPTPRTDAVERGFTADTQQNPQHRLTNLARQLERELAEQVKIKEAEKKILIDEIETHARTKRGLAEAREQRDRLAEAIKAWSKKSWQSCGCNYGCDGRMPLQGEKCEKCKLWDAVNQALAAVK